MRKSGRGQKPRVLERDAQPTKIAPKNEKTSVQDLQDDIEVILDDEEEQQVDRPRKSPKQHKGQTAGSPAEEQKGQQRRKIPKKSRKKLDWDRGVNTGNLAAGDSVKKADVEDVAGPSRLVSASQSEEQNELSAAVAHIEGPTAESPAEEQKTRQKKKTPKDSRKKLDCGRGVNTGKLAVEDATRTLPGGEAGARELEPAIPATLSQPEGHTQQPGLAALKEGLSWALPHLRDRLLDPVCGAVPLRPSLQKVQTVLERLLSDTVDVPGHNNSVLLIGRRGIGKTLVLERTAAALAAKYNSNKSDIRVGFVRLTGLAHTDERAAFREIARQICKIFGGQFSKQSSTYDNQNFLTQMLKEAYRCDKVIIFVLDEWDLFCRRPKQTLLYHLLDACMAPSMQAAVVGVSCRMDADQMLEKRLRSRFSNTRLLVTDPSSDLEDTVGGPRAILKSLLAVSGGPEGFSATFNAAVDVALDKEEVVEALREACWKGNGRPRDLCQAASLAVAAMALRGSLAKPVHLVYALKSRDDLQKAQVEAVRGLSVLELFLLVALDRLRRKDVESLNFEMAFDEYAGLRRGGSYRGVDETAPKRSAFRALERLLSARLVAFEDSRVESKGGLRGFAAVRLLLTQEELEAGLKSNPRAPPILSQWLNRELTSTAILN